jgi:hypothetical protein
MCGDDYKTCRARAPAWDINNRYTHCGHHVLPDLADAPKEEVAKVASSFEESTSSGAER